MPLEHKNALPFGHQLQEYRIDALLGHGGFGITYKAIDTYLEKPVAIKEYLPQELAVRDGQTTVVAKSNADQEFYQWGLTRFLEEAKTLAKFNHPNIVKVLRFIEAHNTAYLVMDYAEGQNLGDYLERHGPTLTEAGIRDIFLPILDGLRAVHQAGLLHRDIKPDNIFLRNDASPMLIDFGSARYSLGEKSRSLSVIVSAGYAPFEQYSSKGKQGPWTDVYGIGASLYRCITGAAPPEASDRSAALLEEEPDLYLPVMATAQENYSKALLKGVDAALLFRIKDRPQSAREMQQLMNNDTQETLQEVFENEEPVSNNQIKKETKQSINQKLNRNHVNPNCDSDQKSHISTHSVKATDKLLTNTINLNNEDSALKSSKKLGQSLPIFFYILYTLSILLLAVLLINNEMDEAIKIVIPLATILGITHLSKFVWRQQKNISKNQIWWGLFLIYFLLNITIISIFADLFLYSLQAFLSLLILTLVIVIWLTIEGTKKD